jgi:tRNA U34 5-methylaminomethyl-2-thiouridine-forming methyltransferase MnmC
MNREIVVTEDGSHSISIPGMNTTYHSRFGAIQESLHVFIRAGLQYAASQPPVAGPLYIFEMGFGTGLNALLTATEAERMGLQVYYEAIEAFPLDTAITDQLNYCEQLQRTDLKPLFQQLHHSEWNKESVLTPHFTLKKSLLSLIDYLNNKATAPHAGPGVNVVYYDAFAPEEQPELWDSHLFSCLYPLMAPGGLLVSYCSKSVVRRALQAVGFRVEKIPGPQGKREMLRAMKE